MLYHQRELTDGMRTILVDWLIEVAYRFKLERQTLFLTVTYLDIALRGGVRRTSFQCPRSALQLLGMTCMFVACKFEETYAPEIRDFVYISDKAFSVDDVRRMEGVLLELLEWNLNQETTIAEADRILLSVRHLPPVDYVTHRSRMYKIAHLCLLRLPDVPTNLDARCILLHSMGFNARNTRITRAQSSLMLQIVGPYEEEQLTRATASLLSHMRHIIHALQDACLRDDQLSPLMTCLRPEAATHITSSNSKGTTSWLPKAAPP